MLLPPPADVTHSPDAPGPTGLVGAVTRIFQKKQTPAPDAGTPPPASEDLDPYANLDPVKLLERFTDAKKDMEEIRWTFERQWWRIILYVLGRQWIFFDQKRNEWRDKRLKKWIPKPVTNKLREVQSAIRSMFAAVAMGTLSRPNGNDPKNIATANTVDGLQPLIHEEHNMDQVTNLADFWFTNLGNVFLHPWWNPDAGEMLPVNEDQCVTCKDGAPTQPIDPATPFQCGLCGGQQSTQVHVTDIPAGKGETDVVSPFEVLLPSYASEFKEVDKLIRVRWRAKAYYTSHYPELAKTLTFENQPQERSLNMFKAIAGQNDMATTPFSLRTGSKSQSLGITEFEYWEKPTPDYPKGLFFRVIGGRSEQVLQDPDQSSPGPLPVETAKGQPLWPWIHMGYEVFGGRLYAAGALDPLFQKQDQLNQLDSHVQLSFQRMANPVWLEPKGTEVEKFTGEPGLVVKYNMLGSTGAGKPERISGEDIRPGVFQLRQQYLSDIEELAGTYDILKGSKPTGVEAFSALQLLVERSQSRFTQAFQARGEGYRQWFAIALELERKYGPKTRTLSLLGPNGTWTFNTFQNADLLGDISIVVEDGTNVPKTALGRRAAMEQANNMGFINASDPDVRYAFLTEMGLTSMMPTLDTAKKAALRQQDAFEQWAAAGNMQIPPPLKIQPWDDPEILLSEMRKWANSDKMQAVLADPKIGQFCTQYLVQYYTQLSTMIQAALAQQQIATAGTDPRAQHPFAPGMPTAPGPGGAAKAPGVAGGAAPHAAQAGHGAGGGQAMARSNGNSTSTAIANNGHPTIPGGH